MSVILLLILFGVWMSWSPDMVTAPVFSARWDLAAFFGGYLLLVLFVAMWGRWLARRMAVEGPFASLGRFNWVISTAQMFVPAWFSVGVIMLGWGPEVMRLLLPIQHWRLEFPGLLLGVAPALLAWMGLWWAQYPVDRAMREQNLLSRLDADMPVYAPPKFTAYFSNKLRMQILFTTAPILMIVALLDGVATVSRLTGWYDAGGNVELIASALAAGVVFLIAPEVLRRVLSTEPLTDRDLRGRLEAVAKRAGIRYREILLWRTHHTVGNAAVMGLLPSVRYVLMTDLLVESLSDDELSAVFAHEVGHVVHRHIAWYGMFFVALGFGSVGLKHSVEMLAPQLGISAAMVGNVFPFFSVMLGITSFGLLSRRFERQADVYAARTIESIAAAKNSGDDVPVIQDTAIVPVIKGEVASHVGPRGAAVFNAALLRVVEVNNLPLQVRGRFGGSLRQRLRFALEWLGIMAGSWLHGTMSSRMKYINTISVDPALTGKFDRRMFRLRIALAGLFVGCGVWAGMALQSARAEPVSVPPEQGQTIQISPRPAQTAVAD